MNIDVPTPNQIISLPCYCLQIEYDGTDFHGWQTQPNLPTIQDAIEQALEVLLKHRPGIVGSGRTDAGVHARGQVAHFKTHREVDPYRLRRSLNGLLPHGIVILSAKLVHDAFHARYDARQRMYHYQATTQPRALDRTLRWIIRPEPDFNLMNEAAACLIGTHHFGAFCKTKSETENRICRLERAVWVPEKRPGDWCFEIIGDRFLHGMVRAIVGTLVQIGHRKRAPDDLPRIMASKDRREAGPAAPAHGLILESVTYGQAM